MRFCKKFKLLPNELYEQLLRFRRTEEENKTLPNNENVDYGEQEANDIDSAKSHVDSLVKNKTHQEEDLKLNMQTQLSSVNNVNNNHEKPETTIPKNKIMERNQDKIKKTKKIYKLKRRKTYPHEYIKRQWIYLH